MADKDKNPPAPVAPAATPAAAMGLGFARTDEMQAKVSEDLKKMDLGLDDGDVATVRVKARSGRPGGHYRAGHFIPGPPPVGEPVTWAEFDTTEDGLRMLQADPSVMLEGQAPSSGAKWPPDGLTPTAQMRARRAGAAGADADAVDSTGRSMRDGTTPTAIAPTAARDAGARDAAARGDAGKGERR